MDPNRPTSDIDRTPGGAPANLEPRRLSFWTIERRLFGLFVVFALAFSSYVIVRDRMMDETEINGAVYATIQQHTGLLTDIAKPRLLLIEPYFATHEMLDRVARNELQEIGVLSQRQGAAIARHRAARQQWADYTRANGLEREMGEVASTADALLGFVTRAATVMSAGGLSAARLAGLHDEGERLYAAHLTAATRLEQAVAQRVQETELAAFASARRWEFAFTLVGGALVFIWMVGGSLATRAWIIKPIRRAVKHFEAIGAGNYSRPVLTRREDEFGEMLRSLDRMRLNLADLVAARDQWLARLRVLSRAVESSDAAIVITDSRGIITYVNPAFTTISGYSAEEALGRTPRILQSGLHPPEFYAELWATITARKVWHGDLVNRHKSGRLSREQMSISPVVDDAGCITHFVAVKTDVTEQRKTEQALQASEERFALAMAGTDDGLWDWNLATDAVYYSEKWKGMLGYAGDELEANVSAFLRLMHPDDRDRVIADKDRYLAGDLPSYRSEFRLRHKDGHWVHILARGSAARDAEGVPFRMVGTHLDLTERVLMESRLAEAERRQREILEQSVQGFYQSTESGRLLMVNPALASILDYDGPLEMLDEWPGFWDRACLDAPRRAAYVHEMHRYGFVTGFEYRLRTRTGRIIWVAENARAVLNDDGSCSYYEGFIEDITQRKEAEQLKTDFVSFVTHQLRTPLSGIRWMLDLARQNEMDEETASFIADAYSSAERLIGLVNDLLDIGRLESGRLTGSPEPVDLRATLDSILADLAPLVASKSLDLQRSALDVPPVLADPQLARQALLNLVSNAVKYTPDGGRVTIEARLRDGLVSCAVADSGIGIPAASQPRLFEKFYRAENASTIDTEGTGLGLYLVRLIAERSGGTITCASVEGQGSTFTLTLPAAAPREHAA